MSGFYCQTRGNSSPQGKPRVYFCCHPDDFAKYFPIVSEQLLQYQNCAVWYENPEDESKKEDRPEDELDQMQLVVVPVTSRLLTEDCRAMQIEIPFAEKTHIPVLPLMMESGLEEIFARKMGNLQFLDEQDNDQTAITYEEKLDKYLRSVLVGDEMAAKIRAAFDAYIFMSYRKKDRKYARELMRLIHQNIFCRNIAIWYDEFLVPGEDFNEAIAETLRKSDLFSMVVTPNLVNEKNYVMTVEYPAAREAGKRILPVEALPADHEKLQSEFKDLPDCVKAGDVETLEQALALAFRDIALREGGNSPEHDFFTGLAYLGGIDVEVDFGHAGTLIRSAADRGLSEAIEKLAVMYEMGEGVERSFTQAIVWREKLVGIREKDFSDDPQEEHYAALIRALNELQGACYEVGRLDRTEEVLLREKALFEEHLPKEKKRQACRDGGSLYIGLSIIEGERGNLKKAVDYCEKAYEMCRAYYEEAHEPETLNQLALIRNKIGTFYMQDGKIKEAEENNREEVSLLRQYVSIQDTPDSRMNLAAVIQTSGTFALSRGDFTTGKARGAEAVSLMEAVEAETHSPLSQMYLAGFYKSLGIIADREKDSETAGNYFQKSLSIASDAVEKTGTVRARDCYASVLMQMGDYYYDRKSYDKARSCYDKTYQLESRLTEETDSVVSWGNLATCCNRLASIETTWECVHKYLMKMIDIDRRIVERQDTAQTRGNLADAYLATGRIALQIKDDEGAQICLEKAIEIEEELVSRSDFGYYRQQLCLCYQEMGNLERKRKHLIKAFSFFKKAVAFAGYDAK